MRRLLRCINHVHQYGFVAQYLFQLCADGGGRVRLWLLRFCVGNTTRRCGNIGFVLRLLTRM